MHISYHANSKFKVQTKLGQKLGENFSTFEWYNWEEALFPGYSKDKEVTDVQK